MKKGMKKVLVTEPGCAKVCALSAKTMLWSVCGGAVGVERVTPKQRHIFVLLLPCPQGVNLCPSFRQATGTHTPPPPALMYVISVYGKADHAVEFAFGGTTMLAYSDLFQKWSFLHCRTYEILSSYNSLTFRSDLFYCFFSFCIQFL